MKNARKIFLVLGVVAACALPGSAAMTVANAADVGVGVHVGGVGVHVGVRGHHRHRHHRHCVRWGWRHHQRYCRRWSW